MEAIKFTPTQRRFMACLQDGHPHSFKELRRLMYNGHRSTFRVHIFYLRQKLRQQNEQEIICEIRADGTYYRLVNKINCDLVS